MILKIQNFCEKKIVDRIRRLKQSHLAKMRI